MKHPEHEKFDRNAPIDEQFDNIIEESPNMSESNINVIEKQDIKSPSPRPQPTAGPSKPLKEFNVVKFKELYEMRKKYKLKEIEQREREQRQFHSKPAPNFQAIHAQEERKKVQQPLKFTYPETPTVVRRHREAQERVQKKVSEEFSVWSVGVIC